MDKELSGIFNNLFTDFNTLNAKITLTQTEEQQLESIAADLYAVRKKLNYFKCEIICIS